MRHQHRLGVLQMRVGRHGRDAGLLGPLGESPAKIRQRLPQFINCRAHKEAQIGSDLFVTAAAAMQFVAHLADSRY